MWRSSLSRARPGGYSFITTRCSVRSTTSRGRRCVDDYSSTASAASTSWPRLRGRPVRLRGFRPPRRRRALPSMYAAAYAILRFAGCSPVLAVTAMAAAICCRSTARSRLRRPSEPRGAALGIRLSARGAGRLVPAKRARAPALRVVARRPSGSPPSGASRSSSIPPPRMLALSPIATAVGPGTGRWLRVAREALGPAAVACVVAHLALAGGRSPGGRAARLGPVFRDPARVLVRPLQPGRRRRRGGWASRSAAFLFASAVAVAAIVTRLPRFESGIEPRSSRSLA